MSTFQLINVSDNYFPRGRAGGEMVFCLLADLKGYQLLQLSNPNILKFFRQPVSWLALTLDSFLPNSIRKLMLEGLITRQGKAPLEFIRPLKWQGSQRYLTGELKTFRGWWENWVAAGIGRVPVFNYVMMSRTFQVGHLQPWIELVPYVRQLKAGQSLYWERSL